MSWYNLVMYIHILSAIVAVGSNITYAVWNVRGALEPAHLGFALRGIAFIDRRVANPAYGLLLLTGLVMVFGRWGFRGWVVAALVLFALLIVVAVFYSRALGRQIQALEAEGQGAPAYERLAGQARLYGIGSLAIALVIAFLMVAKPI
jgi:hypothetical protein